MSLWPRRTVLALGGLAFASPSLAAVDAAAFGARGDGDGDDTAAIQRAIDALGPAGGTLRLPRGIYPVRAPPGASACLTARAGLRLIGEGAMQTVIRPQTPGADALLITPARNWAADFSRIEAVLIGDQRTGHRIGRYGVRLVTGTGVTAPHFTLIDSFIGAGEGAAFVHDNDPANTGGGLYAGLIAGCTLHGGIMLSHSGDSIVVRENILTGDGVGIDATLVPGASLLSVLDNNITSLRGAVRIRSGARVNIVRNNCEHQRPNPGGICIDIGGDGGGEVVGGVVANNLLSTFTGTDFAALLRLRTAVGTVIEGNVFAAGSRGVAGIDIGADCRGVRIGANVWNANVAPRLVDRSHGVLGDPARDPQSAE